MNQKSLISLWNHTQQHPGTSGARVCAAVLLALYNGARFPIDITDLRILDGNLFAAAFAVIYEDSKRCVHEVHQWLNMFSGRSDFRDRFEWLAHEYKCFTRGRTKIKDMPPRPRTRFVFDEPVVIKDMVIDYNGRKATHMVVDELLELSPTAAKIYDLDVPRGMGAKRHAEMLARNAGDAIKLNATQAAAVQTMVDNLPSPNIGADNTPFFNDLAG